MRNPLVPRSQRAHFSIAEANCHCAFRAEEKVFYDTIKACKAAHDLALEGYEEHDVVETLLQEMSQLSSGDDQWQAKLSVVAENLEDHIKEEEEGEIFQKAKKILSDEQAEELGEAFTAEKSKHLSTAARLACGRRRAEGFVKAGEGARPAASGLPQPLGIGRRPPVPWSESGEHGPIAAFFREHQTRMVGRQRLFVDHAAVLGGRAASLCHHPRPSGNRLPRGEHQFRDHDRQGGRPALSSAHRDDMGGPSPDARRRMARRRTPLGNSCLGLLSPVTIVPV
jgi:hypothetical protein